jgi:hypothetical protein
MTEVVAYASLRHYWDHIAPVAECLQMSTAAPLRGVDAPAGRPWGSPLRRDRSDALWLVASYADAQRVAPARTVLLEHGAGQSYRGDERASRSGSYAGGDGLDHVELFLCPNATVAGRWEARYPEARTAVVGAPKLDRRHLQDQEQQDDNEKDHDERGNGHARRRTQGPTVAITWHWPNTLCPEATWALPHYRPVLPELVRQVRAAGGEVLGHGHPRVWRQLRREWARLGVAQVEDFDTVLDQADLLILDNSSAGPEFASLGRPIIWCSAPWYRRDVTHGGRFWDWTEGQPHVQEPGELVETTLQTLADPDWGRVGREAMVTAAYAHRDGRASERAALAIEELAGV